MAMCVDTMFDERNCGACGALCPPEQTCEEGVCGDAFCGEDPVTGTCESPNICCGTVCCPSACCSDPIDLPGATGVSYRCCDRAEPADMGVSPDRPDMGPRPSCMVSGSGDGTACTSRAVCDDGNTYDVSCMNAVCTCTVNGSPGPELSALDCSSALRECRP